MATKIAIAKGDFKVGDKYQQYLITSVFSQLEAKKLLGIDIENGFSILSLE